MIALFAVLTLSISVGSSAFAAEPAMEGTGATNVTYDPGSSTGGDGDGNSASWTIDYPVKIMLDDGTGSADTGRDVIFEAYNTSDKQPYTGEAKIQLWLKQPDNHSLFQIKLKDPSGKDDDQVRMGLTRSTGAEVNNQTTSQGDDIYTSADTQFAELTKSNQSATIKAWLISKNDAKTTKTYTTNVTWMFKSNAYQ